MSFDPDLDAPMLVIYLGSSVANSVRLLLRFRDSGKRGAFFSFLPLPFYVSKIGTKKWLYPVLRFFFNAFSWSGSRTRKGKQSCPNDPPSQVPARQ